MAELDLVVENLLILATATPFYRRLVPKFVFILKNQNSFNSLHYIPHYIHHLVLDSMYNIFLHYSEILLY